jgi:hypothetical protein
MAYILCSTPYITCILMYFFLYCPFINLLLLHALVIYYPYTIHVYYPQIVIYIAMYAISYISHKLSMFFYEYHQYITLVLPIYHPYIFCIHHHIYKLYSTTYTMCYHVYIVFMFYCVPYVPQLWRTVNRKYIQRSTIMWRIKAVILLYGIWGFYDSLITLELMLFYWIIYNKIICSTTIYVVRCIIYDRLNCGCPYYHAHDQVIWLKS